jgi:hypothetical protein
VRIDASSRAVLDSTPLSLTSAVGDERYPVVASAGNQFLVIWFGTGGSLRGTRVRTSDGAVLDDVGFTVAEPAGMPAVTFTRERSSAIAAMGHGRFLAAYTQHDTTTGRDRIKMRLVDASTQEVCTTGQPTLMLTGASELTLECGAGAYSDMGAQAWDGCGNPLQVHTYNSGNDPYGPGPTTSAEGTYTVEYIAWDAMGRTVRALRTVHVDDRTAPTLRLNGPAFLTHTCGSQWMDPGTVATDTCYGNVAGSVQTTGYVNGWVEGVYTLRYDVRDSGGNSAAPMTRTVEVVDCPW